MSLRNVVVESAVEGAIDAAVKHIQDALGETDGGFASVWFCSPEGEQIRDLLRRYAIAQQQFLEPEVDARCVSCDGAALVSGKDDPDWDHAACFNCGEVKAYNAALRSES